MGIRDASNKEKIVILFNALVRFAQIVVAAAALGIYGTQKGYWLDHGLPAKITYDIVVAALSIITAFVFGLIPFVLSYRIVALGAIWDFILMLMWAAAFGLQKAVFYGHYDKKTIFHVSDPQAGDEHYEKFLDHWKTMQNGAYVNLAGLILFLISAVMGVALFFMGKRTSRSSGGKAQYV